MQYSAPFKTTPFFGIKLWVLILSLALLIACLTIIFAVRCIVDLHRRRITKLNPNLCSQHAIPCPGGFAASSSLDRRLLSSQRISKTDMTNVVNSKQTAEYNYSGNYCRQDGGIVGRDDLESGSRLQCNVRKGSSLSLSSREIEAATGGFADCNRIGIGDHGGVSYCGVCLLTPE